MSDGEIDIRREGRAGRITLDRPKALNALTLGMIHAIDAALRDWAQDDAVALILIDGAGEKAFCAGGDIAEMYATGRRGDYEYGRRFWRDEYAINARLAEYAKPVVTFLHGFVMGGGVGVGCHAGYRIVGEGSRIAMPECGIGLVPDVGGSLLLARAPGRLGEYLGLTATRMQAGDAIHAGFSDHFVPEAHWPALKDALARTGDPSAIEGAAAAPPEAPLAAMRGEIDRHFGVPTLRAVIDSLRAEDGGFARDALGRMGRNDPLAMAATLDLVRRQRGSGGIREALALEYRYTARSMERGNFLEGIRAAIIDRDNAPAWPQHLDRVEPAEAAAMLETLGVDELNLETLP